jgi:hypothetical protein
VTDDQTCSLCGHPAHQHDTMPDGTRPCRSVGHPEGLTCTECRRITSPEHIQRITDVRDEDPAFDQAWAAYKTTYDHVREQIGPGWKAHFTDHHQAALASALLAYQEELLHGVAESARQVWGEAPERATVTYTVEDQT